MSLAVSPAGVDFIKSWEGLALSAYRDVAGVLTIGYGHTEGFRDGRFGPDAVISEAAAEALLVEDLAPRAAATARLVEVRLNQNEFDALVSLVYNIGAAAFGRSTVRRRLNRSDRAGAADAFLMWNKARVGGVLREVRGLSRRRRAERALFLKPVAPRKA